MFQNKKGFTLIELIVVIAIIAILAAIAVPAFTGLSAQADEAKVKANAALLCQAANIHNMMNPNGPRYDGVNLSVSSVVDPAYYPVGISEEDDEAARYWMGTDISGSGALTWYVLDTPRTSLKS